MAAQRTLTIYLLSKAQTGFVKPGLQPYTIAVGGKHIGDLYVKTMLPHAPPWVGLFAEAGTVLTNVQSMGSSAVFIVPANHRHFAITFGAGRSLLTADTEDRFGLRVTLNAVDPAKIRSVERLTIDSPAPHGQLQAPTGINIREFGLNLDQDLLRDVKGTPRDTTLGNRLAGKDALHATGSFSLKTLPAALRRYLAESNKNDYKKHFPWVDHIKEVKNSTRKDELDQLLQEQVQRQELDKIWMAVPEIIDWDNIDTFAYRDGPTADTHDDIDLPRFLATLRDPAQTTIAALKRHRVYAINDDGARVDDWSAYECLYAELSIGTNEYLLNSGTWFEVEPAFRNRIETAFNAIPQRGASLPNAKKKEKEEHYNKRIAKTQSTTYALMDRKNILYPDGRNKIEFCDLYTSGQELIHVKPYTGSSTLSHLFAQGVTSAELFAGDPAFRSAVNKKLPAAYQLPTPADALTPRGYTVTYAIIKKGTEPLSVPFFSKVSLTNAITRLHALGYIAQLTKISRNP